MIGKTDGLGLSFTKHTSSSLYSLASSGKHQIVSSYSSSFFKFITSGSMIKGCQWTGSPFTGGGKGSSGIKVLDNAKFTTASKFPLFVIQSFAELPTLIH